MSFFAFLGCGVNFRLFYQVSSTAVLNLGTNCRAVEQILTSLTRITSTSGFACRGSPVIKDAALALHAINFYGNITKWYYTVTN